MDEKTSTTPSMTQNNSGGEEQSSTQSAINSPSSTSQTANAKKSFSPLLIIAILIVIFLGGLLLSLTFFKGELQKSELKKTTEGPPSTLRSIKESGKLVIGTDATFSPMEYKDNAGKIVGYDIDLGNNIAQGLGVKAEFKNIPWDNLFNALIQHKIDVIISSVTITDERKLKYGFSDPYLNAGQVIITARTRTDIKEPSNLAGKKIGVQKGTTNEQAAKKYTSDDLVIRFDDFESATKSLVAGKLDAILSDLPGAKGIISANPVLKIASDPFTNEYYGMVLRKEDTELLKQVNQALSVLRTKGILTDLKQKWLD